MASHQAGDRLQEALVLQIILHYFYLGVELYPTLVVVINDDEQGSGS